MTADALAPPAFRWRRFLAVAGPGIVVMLADTDAGSVITAAQSGAQWGYSLLPLQFILMNALLLPIVLGFLYLLARRLPQPYRLQGAYAAVSGVVIAVTVAFGVYSGVAGLWGYGWGLGPGLFSSLSFDVGSGIPGGENV